MNRAYVTALMTQSHVGTGSGHRAPWYAVPLAFAGLLLLATAASVTSLTPAGLGYPVGAVLGFLPVAVVVVWVAPHHRRYDRFGAANWATLLRGILASLVAGLIAAPEALSGKPEHAWLPSLLVGLGLLLDMVDGRLARRQHMVSAFGARFDIEVDAWTTLVLAVAAVRLGVVPYWALAIGLPRYLFLAAGFALPALAAPLPESQRRRLIGGAATLALGLVLAPVVPATMATAIAAVTVAALALSFALDVGWLMRSARAGRVTGRA